ncbi:MAG: DUF3800 domain-containing protein [Candidatus Thiodiazotropha sp.]
MDAVAIAPAPLSLVVIQPKMKLIFPSESGQEFSPSGSTYLLFIDETGGEDLSDPNFPIFGFGGAGLPASLYISNLINPWLHIKEKSFGGESTQMHAADLKKPTKEQLESLNMFFERSTFCRIACVISDKTAFEGDIDIYNIAVRSFYSRLIDVLKHTEYDDIYMIFEDSHRGNKKNMDYFSRYMITKEDSAGKPIDVECCRFIMSKREREPGLEVADFVAHTAGASVQSRLKGTRTKTNERKDFEAIFRFGNLRSN